MKTYLWRLIFPNKFVQILKTYVISSYPLEVSVHRFHNYFRALSGYSVWHAQQVPGRYFLTDAPVIPPATQIAKFMGPTWGPPRSSRPQVGPMLAPWTLLSGYICLPHNIDVILCVFIHCPRVISAVVDTVFLFWPRPCPWTYLYIQDRTYRDILISRQHVRIG